MFVCMTNEDVLPVYGQKFTIHYYFYETEYNLLKITVNKKATACYLVDMEIGMLFF